MRVLFGCDGAYILWISMHEVVESNGRACSKGRNPIYFFLNGLSNLNWVRNWREFVKRYYFLLLIAQISIQKFNTPPFIEFKLKPISFKGSSLPFVRMNYRSISFRHLCIRNCVLKLYPKIYTCPMGYEPCNVILTVEIYLYCYII